MLQHDGRCQKNLENKRQNLSNCHVFFWKNYLTVAVTIALGYPLLTRHGAQRILIDSIHLFRIQFLTSTILAIIFPWKYLFTVSQQKQ